MTDVIGQSEQPGVTSVESALGAPTRSMWQRLVSQPLAVLALAWIVLLLVCALFAPWLASYDPNTQDLANIFASPSREHWLGTDDLGRDNLSRLLFGARASILASVGVAVLALVAAVPVGLASGYVGGRPDRVFMRVVDGLLSVPPLVLALAFVGVLGPSLRTTVVALAVVALPGFIRLIRGETRAVHETGFVEASRAIGSRPSWIVRRRVLPSVMPSLVVFTSITMGTTLVAEASLSFLGLGLQPPDPSWGNTLRRAYNFIGSEPNQMLAPGLAITLTVLAFNALGDGLIEATGADRPRSLPGLRSRLGISSVPRDRGTAATPPAVSDGSPLLAVSHLSVDFLTQSDELRAVDDVSFEVWRGEIVGLVGESGSGKTVTTQAILRLLASPPAVVSQGHVRFDGVDLLDLDRRRLSAIRGARIGFVFQDALASLNPSRTIGSQLVEAQVIHDGGSRRTARARAVELLGMVGIPDARGRMGSFPHEFSGGMRQRVMIAMALANHPQLLIADEPTTALDVTVQAEILELLRQLRDEMELAIIFVTHDMSVVAELCDRVIVMYAGQVVENAAVGELFEAPSHPYTEALLSSVPTLGQPLSSTRSIPGRVPDLGALPSGCRFHPRCERATESCRAQPVPLVAHRGAEVRCLFPLEERSP